MKIRYSLAMLVAMQVCVAHATDTALDMTKQIATQGIVDIGGQMGPANSIVKDGWYRLQRNATLTIMQSPDLSVQQNVNVPENGKLDLGQDTEVNVMEISNDGQFALIGIDEDIAQENIGVNKEDVTLAWVSLAELRQAALVQVDSELMDQLGTSSLALNLDNNDSEFADTNIASRRGGHAHRRGGHRRGGMTYCLRDVRLTAARFTRHVPQGIAMASRAYGPYKAAGWHPVSYSPSVRIGTACFFSGGRSCGHGTRCGHAAIKISANAWKGAGIRPTPFLRGRPLIGCLTPP